MSAKSNVPWSVKGIDPDARSVAKELARREGMTLGEWMTAMIREKGLDEAGLAASERGDNVVSGVTTEQLRDVIGSLNRLTDRISVAEKNLQLTEMQSREAMGGLNKGLETVFERIKRLEQRPPAAGGDPGGIADIAERLDRLEGHGEKKSWVTSLKALERALTTLVEQVEASRSETEDRLTRNEDVLAELKARLDADDEELRGEIAALLRAIDQTTERVTATEERVSEALEIARQAAESHDETFIARTSNKLQVLGDEIKRTSDQIRTLEQSVDKLQDKIEAGEHRSAEGISRVAQSLDTLRSQIEAGSLSAGEPSAETVRASVSEAGKRMDAVKGAFATVVDRLEGRVTTQSAPYPVPDSTGADDQDATRDAPDAGDPFDRDFDDPLGLSSPRTQPDPDPSGEPEASMPQLEPPFGGLTGPGVIAAGGGAAAARAIREPEPFESPEFAVRPETAQPHLAAVPVETSIEPEPDQGDDPLDDPAWSPDPAPGMAEGDRPRGFDRDPLFDDGADGWPARMTAGLRERFSTDMDNNPSLGWVLVIVAIAAIVIAALRLTDPEDMRPVIVETENASAGDNRAAPPPEPEPSPAALYAEAKEALATASSEADQRRAVARLTEAAELGSSVAQHDLGEVYLNGSGVPVDSARARRWFGRAAAQGHLPSINRLAYLDVKGIGGEADTDSAIAGFTLAAEAGYTKAMVNLGTLYNPDNAWLPDERRSAAESYYWFRVAELRGDSSAESEANSVASRLPADVRAAVDERAAAFRPIPLDR